MGSYDLVLCLMTPRCFFWLLILPGWVPISANRVLCSMNLHPFLPAVNSVLLGFRCFQFGFSFHYLSNEC